MRKVATAAGIMFALAVTVGSATAQRVKGWEPPDCELNTSNYLVNSVKTYVMHAAQTRFADEKKRDLRDAIRVIKQSLQQGLDQNAAVWYYYARYYEVIHDMDGADSAFKKAAQYEPDCTADANKHLRRFWVKFVNVGTEQMRANNLDSAKAAFLRANHFYALEPPTFYYLGNIYATSHPDSAIHYYEEALRLATDTLNRGNKDYQDIRDNGAFNIARMFHRQKQWDSAVTWYAYYRKIKPDDPQAMSGEAAALAASGHAERASSLYDSVLTIADSLPVLDVFSTGVALYQSGRLKVAAEAFQKGLARSPYYRDALYNLSNTYVAMADRIDSVADAKSDSINNAAGKTAAARKHADAAVAKVRTQADSETNRIGVEMEPFARRLVDADPCNRLANRLLTAAFRYQNKQDSALAVLTRFKKLGFDVRVTAFDASPGGGHSLKGAISNLADSGTVNVPALVFEFVTDSGAVVDSGTVAGQTIPAQTAKGFELSTTADGVAAWRYHVKSE